MMTSAAELPKKQPEPLPAPRRSTTGCIIRTTLRLLASLVVVIANLWAVAALAIDVRPAWLQLPLAIVLTVVLVAVAWRYTLSWLAPALGAVVFGLVLGWWLMLTPSATREWQADVRVMPSAQIHGQHLTVRDIRSCTYRSEFDYDIRHYDHTYELDKLRTVDLFLSYWGSPSIAHTMVSFGFADGEFLCFSIEARKEIGEEYSALMGFFRQFEMIYIVADERDVVALRTNYRHGEDVYLYRLHLSPDEMRQLLLDYLQRINHLHKEPEWYNAVSGNCTTAIRMQRSAADRSAWDWRILLNGHLDELLFERGILDAGQSFAELRQRSLINSRALATPAPSTGQLDDFSQRIRRE